MSNMTRNLFEESQTINSEKKNEDYYTKMNRFKL